MSALLVELPLRAGDRIKILEKDGTLIKSGTLVANPSGSLLPYDDSLSLPRQKNFHFTDGVFVMPNKEYRIEVEGSDKGYLVRPLFQILLDDIKHLSKLRRGEARDAFEQSIVDEFIAQGYSDERARQVIEELMQK